MDEFKSVNLAYINVCKSLVQGLDFDKIRQVNVFLGPLLFLLFQFICFFFLLNMFIAIILNVYQEVVNLPEDPFAVAFRQEFWSLLEAVREKMVGMSRKRRRVGQEGELKMSAGGNGLHEVKVQKRSSSVGGEESDANQVKDVEMR
eukprot:766833-Hanusia_phi.AAC.3